MLKVLKQTEGSAEVLADTVKTPGNGRPPKRAITINDIRFDPETAEHVSTHPGGDCDFAPEECRRFDEDLYKTPEGYWFIVRPLAPDEARAWMVAHDDTVLLRQTFPDADAD